MASEYEKGVVWMWMKIIALGNSHGKMWKEKKTLLKDAHHPKT